MNATDDRKRSAVSCEPVWNLCLYVAGKTPRSLLAFTNLKRFCKEHLAGCCTIGVIDVDARPQMAKADNIVALPTLVRRSPKPVRRVIGDLSDTARLFTLLDVQVQA